MTTTLHTLPRLRECLEEFSKSLRVTEGARTLPQEIEALFAELREVETHHVQSALLDSAFPFERVQAELTTCFRQFALIIREVRDRHSACFEPHQLKRLTDLMLIGSHAKVTSLADLDAIRVAHLERARMPAI